MAQIIPVGGEVPAAAAPGIVPVGGEMVPIGGEMRAPDFRSSNDPIQATQLIKQQRDEDEAAQERARPSWLALGAEAVKGLASGLNPLPILEAMYGETAGHFTRAAAAAKRGEYGEMAGELFSSSSAPVDALLKSTIGAHWQQFVKAKKAYEAGRYSDAAGYTTAGMLPLLGPMASQSGEDIGSGDPRTMARGVGEGAAAIRPQLPLEIAGGVVRGVVRGASAAGRRVVGGINLNPAEVASNAFGDARGIPKDLATETGSKWARAAQKRVANSMGGEAVASEMIKEQRQALERVGGELAGDVNPVSEMVQDPSNLTIAKSSDKGYTVRKGTRYIGSFDTLEEAEKFVKDEMPAPRETGRLLPGPATKPIDAGEGVRGSIRTLITQLHDEATKQYGELRKAEGQHLDEVQTPEDPAVVKARETRQHASIGYQPDAATISELRRINAEMKAYGFEGHTWIDQSDIPGPKRGNAGGGQYEIVPGHAGAPVYNDVIEASPGSSETNYSRGDVIRAIDSALETGHYTNVAKGALSVAERRLKGSTGGLSPAMLPPGAGDVAGGTHLEGLSVDLTDAKKALRPIRDRMGAGAQIAPLMGAKADAFRALTRIIDGPDHAPLSVVDEALSDLKSLARGGKNGPALPELRTAGQGTAAYAVSRLDALVRARAAQAGPDVLRALETGRNMTREKVAVGDLFETLREEPVQAFEQLTAPKDKGFYLLKKIADIAPMQMQDVARAWLEKQLDLAKQEGGFGHADKMWSNWNALGPQTKRILFSAPGQTQALDHFFLLAKRLAENPNPSGTAHTLTAINVGSVPVMAGLAKMLYTKKGVDAITRWMSAQPTRGASAAAGAGRAARAAAWTALRVSAGRAGVTLPAAVPLAADADEQR